MSDSRLQSIHLNNPRRDAFRMARERLLASQGAETRVLERSEEDSGLVMSAHDVALAARAQHMLVRDGRHYPLRPGINTLGRNHTNDIIIRHPQVSRRHCSILVHGDGRCEIHNLASLNGTWLNGVRINIPEQLVDGDQIQLGPVYFRFHTERGLDATVGMS